MPATTTDYLALEILDRFPAATEPAIELTVIARSHGHNVTLADLEAGLRAKAMTATADGRSIQSAWHIPEVDGPEGDWIYYERHDERGVAGHGWIDSNSRKLLQAG